ncbi:MAG: penicillin-binding protein activator [Arenicellales bacterium]
MKPIVVTCLVGGMGNSVKLQPGAWWQSLIMLAMGAVLVTGCGPGVRPLPDSSQIIVQDANTSGDGDTSTVLTQGLDPEQAFQGQQIDSENPWELVIRADQAPTDLASDLRLSAVAGFLEIQDYTEAETQANYLIDVYLEPGQQRQLKLLRGRIAQGLGQHQTAIQFLQPLRSDPSLTSESRALVLLVLSDAQLSLDRRIDALISLFRRDPLLELDSQLINQQRILNLLRSLTSLEQSLLQQTVTNNGLPAYLADGWIAFRVIADLPDYERDTQLLSWHSSFPNHPARDQLLGAGITIPLEQFNHVVLLLPLTSPFGNAAQAFYDGFIDAYNQDNSVYKPSISLHDIGEDPGLTPFYYQSAVAEGADFVVGPLGKAATNSLLNGNPPALPTLVLADINPEHSAPNLYGISLSPEFEALQVAQRAFNDGHRQAAIFRSSTTWGDRAANAFTDAWIELGGSIVSNKSFPDTIEDYSRIIQKLLEVNQSVSRERVLSAQLGVNLEFTPRRRDDFDMLFFAGNARQARLLVPQLRFFQAHDLPIYATSNIFSGAVNPAVDADLDKLVFGDMRWMVEIIYPQPDSSQFSEAGSNGETDAQELPVTSSDSNEQNIDEEPAASKPKPQPIAKSPYSFSPLDRLYALGLESYHLMPRLSVLREDPWQRYNGQAFQASIREDGNILRHLEWASFEKGQVILLNRRQSNQPALSQ